MCVAFYMRKFGADLCVCASRAMSPDELVYLGILAASIPVGFLFRYLSEYLDLRLSTQDTDIYKVHYLFLYWPHGLCNWLCEIRFIFIFCPPKGISKNFTIVALRQNTKPCNINIMYVLRRDAHDLTYPEAYKSYRIQDHFFIEKHSCPSKGWRKWKSA